MTKCKHCGKDIMPDGEGNYRGIDEDDEDIFCDAISWNPHEPQQGAK